MSFFSFIYNNIDFFSFSFQSTYYTISFDKYLDFNNNFLNLPLPASERMNSLVILYLEVSYITLFIFFIVSFVLLETLLVHSSSEWNSLYLKKVNGDEDNNQAFNVFPVHFTPEEEHFIDIFVICIPTLIILQIIVPTLGYLYNEEMLYYDTYVSFDVNVIGNQWFWSAPSNLFYRCEVIFTYLAIKDIKETSLSNSEKIGECSMLVQSFSLAETYMPMI